jgi:hypothetical protein
LLEEEEQVETLQLALPVEQEEEDLEIITQG